MELEAEHCRQVMSGSLGFPLRVLFWAAHRRMQPARRSHGGAWLLPQRRSSCGAQATALRFQLDIDTPRTYQL
ncbi:hypothetical protein ACTMU2_10040 [Cupriavidus basilensis]